MGEALLHSQPLARTAKPVRGPSWGRPRRESLCRRHPYPPLPVRGRCGSNSPRRGSPRPGRRDRDRLARATRSVRRGRSGLRGRELRISSRNRNPSLSSSPRSNMPRMRSGNSSRESLPSPLASNAIKFLTVSSTTLPAGRRRRDRLRNHADRCVRFRHAPVASRDAPRPP
jgi:hypothetical protein